MKKLFNQLADDLENWELPQNEDSYEKIKCPLIFGKTIRWYYKDDLEFWKEWAGEDDPVKAGFSAGGGYEGLLVAKPDVDPRGELEVNDVVIIITSYPCEKENPITDWVALVRLIDNEDLVEIIQ